jgi:hypothetical protein
LNIHIEDFQLTGGYRMVSPQTQEYLDIQTQIVNKQNQVNSSTGVTRLFYITELDELRILSESMLIKDE